MKRVTILLPLLVVLFSIYSYNKVSSLDQNDAKDAYLTTNSILVDNNEYNLENATNFSSQYSEEYGVYMFTVYLSNLLPESSSDYVTSSFTIFSKDKVLKPGVYESTSIGEDFTANHFSYSSSISTGVNQPNIFLTEGKLEISKSINNTLAIDYVGEKDGKIIKLHYKGESDGLTSL